MKKIEKINHPVGEDNFLKLMDAWQVEEPEERFFINLPAKVQQALDASPAPWWRRIWFPWTVVAGSIVALALVFTLQTNQYLRTEKNLVSAAVEWGIEDYGWERLDQVLSQSSDGGTLDLPQGLTEYPSINSTGYQNATQELSGDELKAVLEELQKRKG